MSVLLCARGGWMCRGFSAGIRNVFLPARFVALLFPNKMLYFSFSRVFQQVSLSVHVFYFHSCRCCPHSQGRSRVRTPLSFFNNMQSHPSFIAPGSAIHELGVNSVFFVFREQQSAQLGASGCCLECRDTLSFVHTERPPLLRVS